MRPPNQEPCGSAMRACEARVRAAVAAGHGEALRYRAETELIRKAWQIVLCARWEARMRREMARRQCA